MTQTPINDYQVSLTLTQYLPLTGVYPSRDGGGTGFFLGEIGTFAGNFAPAGDLAAGQLLTISQNTAVFSLLENTYGGDGRTNFALPNLQGVAMIGEGPGAGLPLETEGVLVGSSSLTLTVPQTPPDIGGTSQPFDNYQPSLPVRYEISTTGVLPNPNSGADLSMIGRVMPFAGNFDPGGFVECDGRLLAIAQNTDLFSILGTTYGGDGLTTFALPDLRGRDIIGASATDPIGTNVGTSTVSLADNQTPDGSGNPVQPFDNREPSLALNYLIATQGIFPVQGGGQDTATPLLGQIVAFAGNFAPKGWAFANGALLPINQNQALFSLLGTTYGGDGRTTFALPDLRDRTVIGSGNGFAVGQVLGANFPTITADQLPPTCICRGTLILTERGEVAVEQLAVGDRLKTLSGTLKPIVWIGCGRNLVTRANKLARPVIIRAGALADNVPVRDLYLTHGHALYLDNAIGGVLVPVENLVNHRSILWDETARVVEYYHIELEDHDVVLADGAPVESYYDASNRASFHNTRPGSAAGAAKPSFVPVLNGGAVVEAIWAKLRDRAGCGAAADTTDDPDLHLVVDGARLDAMRVEGGAYSFALDNPPAGALRLRSRSGVPSLLGITRHDHRRLGVAIVRIELRQPGLCTVFERDAALLLEGGCHRAERGYCWTDGELALPPHLFAHLTGGFLLSVHIERPGVRYPVEPTIAMAA